MPMAIQNTFESAESWLVVWSEIETLFTGPRDDERGLAIEPLWERLGIVKRARNAKNINTK